MIAPEQTPARGPAEPEGAPAAEPEEVRLRAAIAEAEASPDGYTLFEPLMDLCIHLVQARRRQEAIPLARRLIQILRVHRAPELWRRATAHQLLGQMLAAEDRLEEAEGAFRRALRLFRRAGAAHTGPQAQMLGELGELRLRQGRSPEARRLLCRALRLLRGASRPEDRAAVSVHLRLSRFYDQAQDLDRALRHARRAARHQARAGRPSALDRRAVHLRLAFALWQLGLARIEQGRLAEAQLLGEELVTLDPARGYPLLADLHEAAKRPEGALAALEAGARAAPGDWRLWRRLGDLCAAQGRHGDADLAYLQALRCDGAEVAQIHHRAALNSELRDRPLEALHHLAEVRRDALQEEEEHVYWEAQALRLALCLETHREVEAKALAAALIAEASAAPERPARQEAAMLLCLGRALHVARGDGGAARACALAAFRRGGGHGALAFLLELGGLAAEPRRAQCMLLTVELAFPMAEGARRARRSYFVRALSVSEALELVRDLECAGLERPPELELREWTCLHAPMPPGPRGVYLAGELQEEAGPAEPAPA